MALSKNPKYDLKVKYTRVLEICMIISLSTLVFAFKYFPQWEIEAAENTQAQELITVEDVIATD